LDLLIYLVIGTLFGIFLDQLFMYKVGKHVSNYFSPLITLGKSNPFYAYLLSTPLFIFLVILVHGNKADLPFFGDNVGYIIYNTRWMIENNSWFQPTDHDPGHSSTIFLLLMFWWKIFGTSLWASHLFQYIWGGMMLSGCYWLARTVCKSSRYIALLALSIFVFHPHFFTLMNFLYFEIPMVGFLAWALVGYYTQKPALFIPAMALFLLIRVDAIPFAFFFCLSELLIIPLFIFFKQKCNRRVGKLLLRRWVKWNIYMAMASVPLALWLIVHRLHSGYWLQCDTFTVTTAWRDSWEDIWFGFSLANRWNVFWKEGNTEFITVAIICLITGLLCTLGMRVFGYKPPNRHMRLIVRERIFLFSFIIQATLIYLLFSVKKEILGRYFLTFDLHFLFACIISLSLLTHSLRCVFKSRPSIPAPIMVPLGCLALLIPLNYAVRIHPGIPDRLPILSQPQKDLLKNWHGAGSELNTQLFSIINTHRRAIRWLEKKCAKRDTQQIILADYPDNKMLTIPEAGYIREQNLQVITLRKIDEIRNNHWDYFFTSKSSMGLQFQEDEELIKQVPIELVRQFTPNDPAYKDFTITIYRRATTPPTQ
jgi:hypothetical protein